ncbi:MAG: prepilin-type N-terminal cleavage/methylation domain-containing protein [Patescibacteria group bacterium]|nr:prepilin-type N-terminal cleavage/methylation domain-containing protein [Patescibacteria group bacterium]MDD5121346.1 prepilin-type N-terminal cleavage/methylation domain-containing protein [Patescibacteria group bacterium]MDD5395735.1 prepilin-type N-terminal cleavage/methylation domain-containing protein [Patescibacteria group bacterium]
MSLKNKLHRRGFSLLELIVSVGLISIIIVVATGIYIYAIGSQQKSSVNADLQQDGQNLLSKITKDIRDKRINYSYYTAGVDTPEDALALINDNDSSSANYIYTVYYFNAFSKRAERCESVGNATYCDSVSVNFEPVTMLDIQVEKLNFYIDPTTNPYTAGATTFTVPRVTTVLELSSQKERFGQKYVRLQQTISQRYEEKR